MQTGKIVGLTSAATLGAALSWVLSEPFVGTANEHGVRAGQTVFTYGSFYGWYGHLLLGALIAGPISFVIALDRTSRGRAALCGLMAAVVGGAFTCGLDALSDVLMIRALSSGDLRGGAVPHFIWDIFIGVGLALSVALCTQPTLRRVTRSLGVGVMAGVMGSQANALLQVVTVVSMLTQGINRLEPWRMWDPSRLMERIMLGLIVGLMMGLGTYAFHRASLHLRLGRNEGRFFPLDKGINRVGSLEGIEVPLRGLAGIQAVHCQIEQTQSAWYVTDTSGAGVLVNGRLCGQSWLNHGDTLQIGPAVMTFELAGRVPWVVKQVTQDPQVNPDQVPIFGKRPEPTLRVALVDDMGRRFELGEGIHRVGRDPGSVNLPYDNSVSRLHAELEVRKTGVVVCDMGSANGTFVNESRVAMPVTLQPGDIVKFGRVRLQMLGEDKLSS